MFIYNNEIIKKGIDELKSFINIKTNKVIEFIQKDINSIIQEEDKVIIYYKDLHNAYYLLGNVLIEKYNITECPFEHFGIMIDNARNAVMNVLSIKKMICNLVLLGYNFIGLYMEDCFEVDGEPYFGYMRGKFTQNEIKEIVSFADLFGIEVIPYIQTLAHLNNIFKHWKEYYSTVHDMHDCLLMDSDRTYLLIDNYIKSVKKCFKSNHIHLGLDESFVMCEGRYKELHKDFDKTEVFIRHVNKVCDIAKKYGFEVEAWGDMFIKHPSSNLPKDLTLAIWNYLSEDESKYDEGFLKYKDISSNLSFASGPVKWAGFTPFNDFGLRCIKPAVSSCVKNNIKRYVVTFWGDDGAECSVFNMMASIIGTSSFVYNLSKEEESKKSLLLTNYSFNELMMLDLPNVVFDEKIHSIINPSKYILYEDLFYGINDKPDNLIYRNYFKKHIDLIRPLVNRKSDYSYLYRLSLSLLKVLYYKNNIRIDLINAYKNKDRKSLKRICNIDLVNCLNKLSKFLKEVEVYWMKDNKPNGFEVLQIRISGLIERIKYIRRKIKLYIWNKINTIEELNEVNLSPTNVTDKYNGAGIYNNYAQTVTPGMISSNSYI